MKLRNALWCVPALVLSGCMDRTSILAPDDATFQEVGVAFVRTVTSLDDDGPGTLRATIADAANGDVITFDPTIAGGTISLAAGSELVLNKSLMIVGPSGGITISGGHVTRIFSVLNVLEVVLENLTLIDGDASSNLISSVAGGAILNFGNLTIRGSTIRGSFASGSGGAIALWVGSSVEIVSSTISGNGMKQDGSDITNGGGAIYVLDSGDPSNPTRLAVVNSTISGNAAQFDGGGILNNSGVVELDHVTIAGNGANRGGGIFSETSGAEVAIRNSIIAKNVTATTTGPDVGSSVVVQFTASHSLIGTAAGHDIVDGADGNLVGADPRFELDEFNKPKLADNGGPTHTHALLADSPAIDAADTGFCAAVDQRGVVRPQGAGCDMGAFERQGAAPPPPPPAPVVEALTLDRSGTVARQTGIAVLSGTITCSVPGLVQVEVALTQEQKQRRVTLVVTGSTVISVPCNGTTAWAGAVTGGNGVFVNGRADADAATVDVVPSTAASRNVQLFWSK